MQGDLAIWCPVVLTNLVTPRVFRLIDQFQTADDCRSIDDMKVRIKSIQSQIQGTYVETKIAVSCICLLELTKGQRSSLKRERIIEDRVSLQAFNSLDGPLQDLHYIPELIDFRWDAVLEKKVIIISYETAYQLRGTKEQLVLLASGSEHAGMIETASISLPQDCQAINSSLEENLNLRRQVHFYQTNLSSLKSGIKKAEKDNANLRRQLKTYQNTIEELQEKTEAKAHLVNSKERRLHMRGESKKAINESNKIGQRIKNLFIDNS